MAPRVNDLMQEPPLPVAAGTGVPGVLVVDDDRFIRDLLRRFLQLKGFRPFIAESGVEAVEVYRANSEDIGVVLLDVRMPVLDGPCTLAALRGIDPDIRCCFMSGDIDPYSVDDLTRMGALHLFEKPLHMGLLADALRKVATCPVR